MLTTKSIHRVGRDVPEGQRLFVLNLLMHERVQQAREATLKALSWHKQLQACTEVVNGEPSIRVVVWQRDCDMCEGWHSYVCAVANLQERIESDLQWAEGPMHHGLDRPSHEPDLPQSRDLVLEAHEGGHAWCVRP
jgi:hypothetical protein